jgi:cytochrome c biogenesis protein CcmG/thiol:disulfide interchange protein DsbE
VADAPAASPRSRARPLVAVAIGAAALAVIWTIASIDPGRRAETGRIVPGRPVAVDRPAPAFSRPLLRGTGTVSLASFRGSVVVVNFWRSWCRACRTEASSLDSLSRSYRDRGVRFVGVDYVDRTEPALSAERSFGFPYPSVVDASGSLGDAFGIVGLPMTYIIGPDQRISYIVAGRLDPRSFRTALDSVLARTGDAST